MNRALFVYNNVPAVFHQVEDNLVQHLLKQSCPDPQVLDSLWGEAGQSGHLANAVLTLQALTSSVDEGSVLSFNLNKARTTSNFMKLMT